MKVVGWSAWLPLRPLCRSPQPKNLYGQRQVAGMIRSQIRFGKTNPAQHAAKQIVDGYRKLVEADAAAQATCNLARAAFRAYRRARRSLRILLKDANPPVHMVYSSADESAIDDAAFAFAAAGLSRGDAVVLLTTSHRYEGIERRLKDETFDVQAIRGNGQLVFVDAVILLADIIGDGIPDVVALNSRLGQIIGKASVNPASGQPRRVRIYGELVNLLYVKGNILAAQRVEELDKEIVSANPAVTIFCAYSLRLNSDQLPQSLLDNHSQDLSLLFK